MKYYKCVYCGRIFKSESIPDVPHNCNHGFRKIHLEFTEIRVLDLPLKSEWYEMIESGEKREEYREIKPYWARRLCSIGTDGAFCDLCEEHGINNDCNAHSDKGYTLVRFRYGYTKRTILFELKRISIGIGKPEWGAPDYPVFCIKLGKIIER